MKKKKEKDHQIRINRMSAKGGKVELNNEHRVWASYAVATSGDIPPPELFYAGITLLNGDSVVFFCNRETGLTTVEVVSEKGADRIELLRAIASESQTL